MRPSCGREHQEGPDRRANYLKYMEILSRPLATGAATLRLPVELAGEHPADFRQRRRLHHLDVLAIDLVDGDPAADIRLPGIGRWRRVAARRCKEHDIAIEDVGKEIACELAVALHDLKDRTDLVLLEIGEDISLLTQDAQRARDLERRIS